MKLEVLRGPKMGIVFTLVPGENTAGRSEDNHIHLPSSHVSGRHCAFVWQGEQLMVSDRGSTNGVYVEGHKVREAALAAGQRVQIGDWLLLVSAGAAASPPPPGPSAPSDRSVTRPSYSGPPPAQPAPPPPQAAPPPPPATPPAAGGSTAAFGRIQNADGSFGGVQAAGFGAPEPVAPASDPPAPPASAPPPPGGFGFGGAMDEQGPPTVTHDVPEAGAPAPAAEPSVGFGAGSSGFGGAAGGFGAEPGLSGAGEPGFTEPPSYGGISPAADRSVATPMPDDLPGKAKHVWRRVRKLPWSIQLAAIMLLASFCMLLAPYGGVISQVRNARKVGETQVIERAKALSLALSARNIDAIAQQNNLALDANFLLGQPGVKVSMITDQRGVVRAPPEKVRQSIGGKDYFEVATERGGVSVWRKGGGLYHVLAPIRVAHVEGAPASIMGWAYLQYDVSTAVSESTPVLGRFVFALMVLFGIFGAVGLSIWRLSTAPISAVREELELAMRGHIGQIAVPTEWRHLRDLTHSINRLLYRWKRGDQGSEAAELDPGLLVSMVQDMPVPVFMVGTELEVLGVSGAAAAWLQVQPDALEGRKLAELLPDHAFLELLSKAVASVTRGAQPTAAQATSVGGNRVAIRVVKTGVTGVVAIVAVG